MVYELDERLFDFFFFSFFSFISTALGSGAADCRRCGASSGSPCFLAHYRGGDKTERESERGEREGDNEVAVNCVRRDSNK